MKHCVKVIGESGPGFLYFKSKCSRISEAKIKEGIFVGPQIREPMKNHVFEEGLNGIEKAA